ncbi:MAG: glycosyltransferase, partial [Pseudomonadota bacterium]
MSARPRVAFHAPMKPPGHPTPSGDRRIARLTLAALERAGFAPFVASDLRSLDMAGDPARQAELFAQAEAETARLLRDLRPDPPALWFTYHCYWKAPDLLGPAVSQALGIPYAVSEASHSPRRREGPWAAFAEAADRALQAADLVLYTTPRDLPGLEALLGPGRPAHLPAFLDLGPPPAPKPAPTGPLRLIAAAMMRPGDKLASYRALAAALARLDCDWTLEVIGDGPARPDIEALLAPFPDRIRLRGAIHDPAALRAALEAAELLVWPGVGEGVGMIYLEAQAAGTPCLAEDRPGPRDLLPENVLSPLPPPDDPQAFAAAIARAAADRPALA